MDISKLKAHFLELVPSHPPNGWEIEEHLENIEELTPELQELVFSQVPAIWPVSHSLCYSYLDSAKQALACLSADRLTQWVGNILDIYEKDGLRAAQSFMDDVESNFLCRIRGEAGVNFSDTDRYLTPYARSIIERRITLAAGSQIYTDTEFIYIPKKLALCSLEQENFLLYKLIITFQLGLILQKTYEFSLPSGHGLINKLIDRYGTTPVSDPIRLDQFFTLFPDPDLAEDIFTVIETQRISSYLASAFPGLWRDTVKIRSDLAALRIIQDQWPLHTKTLEALTRIVMTGANGSVFHDIHKSFYHEILAVFDKPTETAADSANRTETVYTMLSQLEGNYIKISPLYYAGRLRPAEARKGILRRRNAVKEEFVKILASVIHKTNGEKTAEPETFSAEEGKSHIMSGEEGMAMIVASSDNQNQCLDQEKQERYRFLTLDGPTGDLPEPLRSLAEKIVADLGYIPNDYISAAQGLSGHGHPPGQSQDSLTGESLIAPLTYDEWDYRRSGFRKDWCLIQEKELQPVKGTFIETTLDKYQGLLRQLKKQFEMLRSKERFIKRQRHGDDIDLDALIESIADIRADKPSSERLFIRLQRDERDIAVLFLVDMSSSTEGWINQALKEALILMGEALHVLGDRFAIYGFSGMRRLRSDFYHVKNFTESYNQEVKERIAAIAPQEYTRMGPPLRHAVKLLQDIDAKVRLIVTLSDGKPEDYDDYKGEYAIEDTRHALIEAKTAGIQPFCITIDKKAHDYIGHMYGEVNYIFVNEVRKLPFRLPEIYRVLTT